MHQFRYWFVKYDNTIHTHIWYHQSLAKSIIRNELNQMFSALYFWSIYYFVQMNEKNKRPMTKDSQTNGQHSVDTAQMKRIYGKANKDCVYLTLFVCCVFGTSICSQQ